MITARLTVAVVLLLWATMIGEEALGPLPAADKTTVPRPAANYGLNQFATRPNPGFDKELFLVSFRRQSALALTSCLRSWHSPPGSILVRADLRRQGILANVQAIERARPLPDCATEAIQAMRFPEITNAWKVDSQALQWRIDF